MRHPGNRRIRVGVGAAAGALVLSVSGFAAPAFATAVNQTGGVSPTAASGTPALTTTGNTYEAVRELQQCGSTMYAVGQFTTITQSGQTITRNNIFSFSATAPYTLTSWAPDVNGIVDTIAFNGTNCADAYIGGDFTSVNGTTADHIAEIDTTTGALVSGFAHDANDEVFTLAVVKDTTGVTHVLAGGQFTSINGSSTKYYVSLNPSTGLNDNYVNFGISGTYVYPGAAYQTTKVYNQQVSHGGARVMVEGVFTTVKGQARQQVFQEWLGPNAASITTWVAPIFNDHCVSAEPYYARAAAWAPDDSTVYVATTGDHLTGNPVHLPLTGPCDATMAFSGSETSESPEWTNYTGCDSLYAAAADDYAVYVAGHPRWSNNPNGCNVQGTGAIPDRGLQGLNPANGQDETDSQGTALYTMSRSNADDEIITSAGLWIASTNRYDSGMCGNVQGVSGVCFLPYTS